MVNRFLQIIDNSIGDDQQNVILLVHLINLHLLGHIGHEFGDRSEVRGTIQVDLADRVLIGVQDTFNPITLRVKDVAIESEAMVRRLVVGRNRGAETKGGNLLIAVVVLEDVADGLDGAQVFILVVHIVQ